MKTVFTKKELLEKGVCFSKRYLNALWERYDKKFTIIKLLNDPTIAICNKIWFICRICNLSKHQKLQLAISLGNTTAIIYSATYPDDTRIEEHYKILEAYLNKKASVEELTHTMDNCRNACDDVAKELMDQIITKAFVHASYQATKAAMRITTAVYNYERECNNDLDHAIELASLSINTVFGYGDIQAPSDEFTRFIEANKRKTKQKNKN
jgi:hypothetical protein